MTSTSTPVLRPTTILRHQIAIYPAMAMLAGMQLDVFTPLSAGSLTAPQVAAALGVDAAKLAPLLYALVAAELLTVQDDRFSNTAEAETFLVQGRPAYFGGSRREFYADIWQALLKTSASIRANAPQHKHDFYAMSEQEMLAFFRGQHHGAVTAGEYLANTHDLGRVANFLDVGGGSGGVAIGACQTCPDLTATVVDLPSIIPITQQFVDASPAAGRIKTVATDVVTAAPPGAYDVIVMRNLIQVLSLENAQALVHNVGRSLKPGGSLFIAGGMIEDTRTSPTDLAGQNLVFLNIYDDGLIYTEGEYRGLLVAAGLSDIQIWKRCMPGGESLILARRLA